MFEQLLLLFCLFIFPQILILKKFKPTEEWKKQNTKLHQDLPMTNILPHFAFLSF